MMQTTEREQLVRAELTRLAERIAFSAHRRRRDPDVEAMVKFDREADRIGLTREEHDRILIDVSKAMRLVASEMREV